MKFYRKPVTSTSTLIPWARLSLFQQLHQTILHADCRHTYDTKAFYCRHTCIHGNHIRTDLDFTSLLLMRSFHMNPSIFIHENISKIHRKIIINFLRTVFSISHDCTCVILTFHQSGSFLPFSISIGLFLRNSQILLAKSISIWYHTFVVVSRWEIKYRLRRCNHG